MKAGAWVDGLERLLWDQAWGLYVLGSSADNFGVLAKKADRRIAIATEQPTNLTAIVAVIHDERRVTVTRIIRSTNSAHARLTGKNSFIVGDADPVWAKVVLALLTLLGRITTGITVRNPGSVCG
jgi:hypothetical protein